MFRGIKVLLTKNAQVAGMEHVEFAVRLDPTLLRAARDVAGARDISVGQLVRDALNAEITRSKRKARSPVRADERMIARLRAQLGHDLAYAGNWFDLDERLRRHGMTLREAGGGLALFAIPGGARLCKASDLGCSLQTLTRRFGRPYPTAQFGLAGYQALAGPVAGNG